MINSGALAAPFVTGRDAPSEDFIRLAFHVESTAYSDLLTRPGILPPPVTNPKSVIPAPLRTRIRLRRKSDLRGGKPAKDMIIKGGE